MGVPIHFTSRRRRRKYRQTFVLVSHLHCRFGPSRPPDKQANWPNWQTANEIRGAKAWEVCGAKQVEQKFNLHAGELDMSMKFSKRQVETLFRKWLD